MPAQPAITSPGEVTQAPAVPTASDPHIHAQDDAPRIEPTADSADGEGKLSPRPEGVHSESSLTPVPEKDTNPDDNEADDSHRPPEDEQEAKSVASHPAEEITHHKDAPAAEDTVSENYDGHHASASDATPSVLVKTSSSSLLSSFYLFSAPQQSDEAEGEAPTVFHNEYKHLFVEPMEHTFSLLRTLSVDLGLMPHGELSLTFEALDLTITEVRPIRFGPRGWKMCRSHRSRIMSILRKSL